MMDLDAQVSVLLVDDLDENLVALEALLQRDGVQLLKAKSGDEALELLLTEDVAIALLDVQMPGMDGFQLAEFMRGNARVRHVPIIFVTAGSAEQQRRFRGYEAGAIDFIQKPIEPDILRMKTEIFIELYKQRERIRRQRDELESQATALSAADRRKNEFLAVLGHELRNPIMSLSAGLQLLDRTGEPGQSAIIRERMATQVFHLARLVEDLLDVSRIDQGKIALRLERVLLKTVLESAIETSRPRIDVAGHVFTYDEPEKELWVMADFTRLSQIVSNLLINAAKYTPHGGAIHLLTRATPDSVEVAVSDNGVGISKDMQDRVFQLYTQVEGRDAPREGLGIGLALVRQLVDLHQGDIHVESDGPGTGSCFTVRLPRSV